MKTSSKPLIASTAVALALASTMASAGHGQGFPDRARVISSTPVYEQVNEPRRECWTERVSYHERAYRNDSGNALLGAIVGGLVGSTVGSGSGKVAAAAVGAATGAVIGDRWNDRDGHYAATRGRPVEQCRLVDNYRQQIVGYDVVYRYQDKEFATRLPYDPGKWLEVNVHVGVADSPPRDYRGGDPRDSYRDNEWRY
jgi:uncharacterized protein YcfJ